MHGEDAVHFRVLAFAMTAESDTKCASVPNAIGQKRKFAYLGNRDGCQV